MLLFAVISAFDTPYSRMICRGRHGDLVIAYLPTSPDNDASWLLGLRRGEEQGQKGYISACQVR